MGIMFIYIIEVKAQAIKQNRFKAAMIPTFELIKESKVMKSSLPCHLSLVMNPLIFLGYPL